MQFWTDLILNPIIIITALIIGTLGEVMKRLVSAKAGDRGLRGFFYVTLPAHPVIVGSLLGLIPWLPVPDSLQKDGYEFATRLGTYALAGLVCKLGYDSIVSTGKRLLGQDAARTETARESIVRDDKLRAEGAAAVPAVPPVVVVVPAVPTTNPPPALASETRETEPDPEIKP